jgi:aspartate-semialdehyde dehydrogenase
MRARIAIAGATGSVGSQIADLIGERDFSYSDLTLFAAEEGVTQSVESGGRTLTVARLESPAALAPFDMVFLALPHDEAARIVGARPGPLLIDLSAAARPPLDAAPLAAPGLTPRERVRELARFKLFAIAHPAAQVIATVLKTLGAATGFAAADVILSASAAGRESVAELFRQSVDLLNARLDLGDNPTQVAFNLFLPPGGRELAYAITAQATALLGAAPALAVNVVRAPAFHGAAVTLSLPGGPDAAEWPKRLRSAPGIILVESDEASGFIDAAGQEAVIVRMFSNPSGTVTAWCVFDSARIAALSAVWIAESVAAAS